MDIRVRLSAWATVRRRLLCRGPRSACFPRHTERATCPAKPPASTAAPTRPCTSDAWPTPRPPHRPSRSAHASSCGAPPTPTGPASRATTTSPHNSAVPPTPSPSGGGASNATASAASTTSPAVAARPLFPPEDRPKVLVLATTRPAALGAPPPHWPLDALGYHVLRDAHYRDMARSTIQRILAEADLRPHRSRYWLHSDDPDFEAKALAICRLYLDAPRLYRHGELVVCVDEKTSIQALQRLHPTK